MRQIGRNRGERERGGGRGDCASLYSSSLSRSEEGLVRFFLRVPIGVVSYRGKSGITYRKVQSGSERERDREREEITLSQMLAISILMSDQKRRLGGLLSSIPILSPPSLSPLSSIVHSLITTEYGIRACVHFVALQRIKQRREWTLNDILQEYTGRCADQQILQGIITGGMGERGKANWSVFLLETSLDILNSLVKGETAH